MFILMFYVVITLGIQMGVDVDIVVVVAISVSIIACCTVFRVVCGWRSLLVIVALNVGKSWITLQPFFFCTSYGSLGARQCGQGGNIRCIRAALLTPMRGSHHLRCLFLPFQDVALERFRHNVVWWILANGHVLLHEPLVRDLRSHCVCSCVWACLWTLFLLLCVLYVHWYTTRLSCQLQ